MCFHTNIYAQRLFLQEPLNFLETIEMRRRVGFKWMYLWLGEKRVKQWSWGHHLLCLIFSHLSGSTSITSQGKTRAAQESVDCWEKIEIKRHFLTRSQPVCPKKSGHEVTGIKPWVPPPWMKPFTIDTHQEKGCLSQIYKFVPQIC